MRDVFVLASATYVRCQFRTAFLEGVKGSHNRPRFDPMTILSAKLFVGFGLSLELCGDANVK